MHHAVLILFPGISMKANDDCSKACRLDVDSKTKHSLGRNSNTVD